MARYNTSSGSTTINGTATISSPTQGAFTNLTGTAPYTVTLPNPILFPGSNQTFYNATSGTITLSTPGGVFSGTGASGTSTNTIFTGNVLSVTSDGTNYIVISEDGSPLIATTGSFSSDVTITGASATVNIQPSSLTLYPGSIGAMDRVAIGVNNRSSGAFTTLAANGQVSLTANTASTSTSTGSLVVTGGVGVTGNIWSGATVNASSVVATSLTGTLQTAAQANITSTGDLTVPSLSVTNSVAIGASSASFATIDTYAQRGIEIVGTKENGTAPVLRLRETGSGLGAFEIRSNRQGATSGNYLALGEGTGTFMVIRGDDDAGSTTTRGFVGIGTTSPSTLLHVAGTINAQGIQTSGTPSLSFSASKWMVQQETSSQSLAYYCGPDSSTYGTHFLYRATSTGSPQIVMTYSPSGHVGIGSTSTSTRVDIRGTSASASATLQIVGNSVSTLLLGQDADGGVIRGQGGNNSIRFLVGGTADQAANGSGTESLRIVPSGVSFYADLYPSSNNGFSCGTSSNRWKNVYTNDLHLSNEGKEGGNTIDKTTGDWTIEEGAENLYIVNNKSGKKYAFVLKEIE